MERTSRRQFLVATASGVTVGLAGCLGGGSAELDEFSTEDRPFLGSSDAPVQMAVFEDFACPGCRDFKTQVSPAIIQEYVQSGDVLYYHADFPIPVDGTWSYAVPSAAWAIYDEAGNDAFWTFTASVYQYQNSYSYDLIEDVAAAVGQEIETDAEELGATARSAAEDETYRDQLDDDYDLGEEWGVTGTPTVFVGEESVDWDFDTVSQAIEEKL